MKGQAGNGPALRREPECGGYRLRVPYDITERQAHEFRTARAAGGRQQNCKVGMD